MHPLAQLGGAKVVQPRGDGVGADTIAAGEQRQGFRMGDVEPAFARQ